MRVSGVPEETYTYERLYAELRSVSAGLKAAGVSVGDRVAVIGENHPCWAVAYLGVLYSGAVCVPLDPHGEVETLCNFLNDSETKVVFVGSESIEKLEAIEARLDRRLDAVVWRTEPGSDRKRFEDWVEVTPGNPEEEELQADGKENALLIYTSGTTGKPKGVLLSHGNICAELDAIDNIIEVSPEERILSLLPLFHAYLQIAALWIASTKGCEVIYPRELTPEALSEAMQESRMTIFATVPRLWYMFHKRIFDRVEESGRPVRMFFRWMLSFNGFLRDRLNLNLGRIFFRKVHEGFGGELRLAISAGSRFDEQVAKDFHRLGFTILQGYGLTETSGAATGTHMFDNKVGSVGKPVVGAEVKIDKPDESGEGEVLIRGPMVFSGYYRNPEATAEAFTEDGWFRSGDLGKFDSGGNLYITGRSKDVIVLPSGKNVHPEDLEVHYLRSPLVSELCVLGIADPGNTHAGAEKLAAVVVPDFDFLRRQNIANAREAIRFALDDLGRDLPEYQRVRDYIVRSDPLPRTRTNKIKRFELRTELNGNGGKAGEFDSRKDWEFSDEDRGLVAEPAAAAVIEAIRHVAPEAAEVHPDMNLEIDLRLDSLARAELLAGLESSFGYEPDPGSAATAFTVRDLVSLFDIEAAGNAGISAEADWRQIFSTDDAIELPEAEQVLKARPFFSLVAFVSLKAFYLWCRIFLRMRVEGVEHLTKLERPYLICPNHQSYLDAFVVCSAYPYSLLKNIFHVGASEYFQGTVTGRMASFLNIVPIDPDTHLLKAMRAGAAGLRSGKILNIYPEGERAYDGSLHNFKNGAAILSKELDLPIVPVALDGMHKVWARRSNRIRLARVSIRFGEPIYPSVSADGRDYTAYSEIIKSKISDMLAEIRKT